MTEQPESTFYSNLTTGSSLLDTTLTLRGGGRGDGAPARSVTRRAWTRLPTKLRLGGQGLLDLRAARACYAVSASVGALPPLSPPRSPPRLA
jgi:hypothetical protein